MSRPLTFHVPPEARPLFLRALLAALDGPAQEGPVERPAILERMAPYLDTRPRGEVITFARDLGLIVHDQGGFALGPSAKAIERSTCPNDLVHGLQYFAWSPDQPDPKGAQWTYRTVVDLLWAEAPVSLNSQFKKRLVEDVLARAQCDFAIVPTFDAARVSVGPKSIDGVGRWLEELSPPVLREGVVRRRETCPPPLLIMALGAAARIEGISPNADFRLTAEHRALLARCCFIEPECLDRMLEWTIATQPKLLRWGSLVSTYGRQVVLARTDIGPEDVA